MLRNYLRHLVERLMSFFMECSPAPGEENENCRDIDLRYLFNLFLVWNSQYAVYDSDAAPDYNDLTRPRLDAFEAALRWCFKYYDIPGDVCIQENGCKYVQGVRLNVDAFSLEIFIVDYLICSKLEDLRRDVNINKNLDSEIAWLEALNAEVEEYLRQAYDYEKRMGDMPSVLSNYRHLNHLSDRLLSFFMARSFAPDKASANCQINMDYLYNMFMIWNYMCAADDPDTHYNCWLTPDLHTFEQALRLFSNAYNFPGEITQNSGRKYVQGIALTVDAAMLNQMFLDVFEHKLSLLQEDGNIDEDIIPVIGLIERLKEDVEEYVRQARGYEECMELGG